MDISFKTEQGRFNYRTAGVLIQDGKLLVMQDENSPYYYVPGGRVSFGEATEAALQREIREELGIDVVVQRLLWVVESFFEENRTKELFHELAFYYLLTLADPGILHRGASFSRREGDQHTLRFTWKELRELQNLYFYPLFLKQKILDLPIEVEHIVDTNDLTSSV